MCNTSKWVEKHRTYFLKCFNDQKGKGNYGVKIPIWVIHLESKIMYGGHALKKFILTKSLEGRNSHSSVHLQSEVHTVGGSERLQGHLRVSHRPPHLYRKLSFILAGIVPFVIGTG